MTTDVGAIANRELDADRDRIESVEEGLLHETYELRAGGTDSVLQFASGADERQVDALERGVNCYVMLQDADVPVPAVVTETVRTFDGRRYVLVEQAPGTTGAGDISPENTRNAGRQLATIHDVRTFETAGWIRFEDGKPTVRAFQDGRLKHRIRRITADRADVFHAAGLERVRDALESILDRLESDLPTDFQPVLCHNDCSPDNVLFEDGEVTGILDFDRAYAGHAQRDLVQAANGFWMHDPCADWDVRATFYEGYRQETDLADSFGDHETLYRVETLADVVAGLLELDELSDDEREFYADRILSAIDRVEGR